MSNTTGYYNTANGYQTLRSNTTGGSNTANGYKALQLNTTGFGNVAVGTYSLDANTTGQSNNAVGYASLSANTTGNFNNATGSGTLQNNTTGICNSGFGQNVLNDNTTGNYNTAIGCNSLSLSTTGWNNTAIGNNAGTVNTTGSNNTYLGSNADGAATIVNSTAIGYNAYVATSNSIVLGNGENVGIGTSSPSNCKLHVNGTVSYTMPGYGYLNFAGNTGTNTTSAQAVSIYASGRVAASIFMAFSDKRIKDVVGQSNSENDLSTLMKIKVTDYSFIDKVQDGFGVQKKVIAQELKEIYPSAVDANTTRIVPDVMLYANIENGWVNLANHDLKVGNKVRLIFEEGSEELDILEINQNAFKVASKEQGKLLVYGREVHDFHTVDYESLTTLNISATQELLKRIEKLEQENNSFKVLEAKYNSLNAEVSEIKALLNQTANK